MGREIPVALSKEKVHFVSAVRRYRARSIHDRAWLRYDTTDPSGAEADPAAVSSARVLTIMAGAFHGFLAGAADAKSSDWACIKSELPSVPTNSPPCSPINLRSLYPRKPAFSIVACRHWRRTFIFVAPDYERSRLRLRLIR